jgi:hypothetical protein
MIKTGTRGSLDMINTGPRDSGLEDLCIYVINKETRRSLDIINTGTRGLPTWGPKHLQK